MRLELSENFGNIIAAAQDLGVDRKDLRRLTWHNPDILRPAHERICFFISRTKPDLTQALLHGGADARRRAGERLLRAEATPGDPLDCGYGYSTLAFLTPADRRGRASIEAEEAARIAAEQAGKLRLAVEEAVAAERARDVARQSGWEGGDSQDGHFGGRGGGDDCRGATITQALFGMRADCRGATIRTIP